ncbi:MAG: hypothetical protein AB1696_21235 [Planctomycetota bacterium]
MQNGKVDIGTRGEVFRHAQDLLHSGQIRDCIHMKIKKERGWYVAECSKDFARRQKARNVQTDPTGYGGPSWYSWPECPNDCEFYERSEDFTKSALAKEIHDAISTKPLDRVVSLCQRFPVFAEELAKRGRDRQGIEVQDEYDVQYLFRAMLRIEFDDVRPEEPTPSKAGGGAKLDFLLKNERIGIEIKKTRDSLRDAQIGEELVVDIERYAAHPDCSSLVCFVYDPEKLLDNSSALERDLSRKREGIDVRVVIVR